MNRLSLTIMAGALSWSATVATAAPQPGIAPRSWQLDFEFYDPQRITLRAPGEATETTYWYLLYRVTNRTGQDVQFFPSARLVTSTLEVVEAGDDIGPGVYRAIKVRHRDEFPFFEPPSKITGELLQGEGNARVSAAVFQSFDLEASGFKLYFAGLSGELERVINPVFDPNRPESKDNPRSFLLRRTLEIVYDLPGDPDTRAYTKPIRRSREWVMR
jgi:hypothetical protein